MIAITIVFLSALFISGLIQDQTDKTVLKMKYESELGMLSEEKKLILLTRLNTVINQRLTNDKLISKQQSNSTHIYLTIRAILFAEAKEKFI